jgi:hypothetical protein
VKRLRERSRQYVDNEYNFDKQAADRIEQLEAALFSIYVSPNDIPFIKAQIDAVIDVNECRQKWGEKNDQP